MMQSICTAIYNAFLADTALKTAVAYTATRPGFYYEQAPDDAIAGGPYATYTVVTATPNHVFGGKTIEDLRVQFTMVSRATSPVDAGTSHSITQLFDDLTAWADAATLTYGGGDYAHVGLLRLASVGPVFMQATQTWEATADYRVIAQKT